VTSSPGNFTANGTTSPIIVAGLSNGISYTFTVTATNTAGTGSASSASNSVTPVIPPATTFTFTGPTTGSINAASTNFTVTPNNPYSGTITLTPSGGGLSTPIALVFSNSAVPQTFTITPTAVGTVTLTPSNTGPLTNPSNLSYTVTAVVPGAPTSVTATPGNTQATVTFSPPVSNGGATITNYTVTSTPGNIVANGGASPIVVTGLSNGISYTFVITATNNVGTSTTSSPSNSVTPVGVTSSATVAIIVPSGGATLSGSSVPLTATVSGNSGPTSIQFQVDSINVGSIVSSSPYTTTWNSTTVSDGTHTITAVLTDNNGTATSPGINVSTLNNPVSSGGGGGGGGGGSYYAPVTTPVVATTPTDCTATTLYSALTGLPCPSSQSVIPAGCTGTTLYSALTGQECSNYVSAAVSPATPAPSSVQQTPATTTMISVTAKNLNIRTSPSTGTIIATVPKGTVGTVIAGQSVSGWLKVQFTSGVEGYVYQNYTKSITSAGASTNTLTPSTVSTVRVAIHSGRVRIRSTIAGRVVGYVANATLGTVLERVPSTGGLSWVKVKFPKVTGWLSSFYLVEQ
jgi:hypothetical protein